MRFGVMVAVIFSAAAVWFWPQIESAWRGNASAPSTQATVSDDGEPSLRAPHFDEDRPRAARPKLRHDERA